MGKLQKVVYLQILIQKSTTYEKTYVYDNRTYKFLIWIAMFLVLPIHARSSLTKLAGMVDCPATHEKDRIKYHLKVLEMSLFYLI
jgi:hypothetical protein